MSRLLFGNEDTVIIYGKLSFGQPKKPSKQGPIPSLFLKVKIYNFNILSYFRFRTQSTTFVTKFDHP
jgi:hypothetical protein